MVTLPRLIIGVLLCAVYLFAVDYLLLREGGKE